MKSFIILLSLLATGCAHYPYQSGSDQLANVPTESHERKVAVLFEGDTPSDDYINIGVLEAWGGEFTSYNDLIRQLQQRAQEQGVDAIRILDKDYIEDTEEFATVETDVTSVLSGIGILYLKNADYLSPYLRVYYRFFDPKSLPLDEALVRVEKKVGT